MTQNHPITDGASQPGELDEHFYFVNHMEETEEQAWNRIRSLMRQLGFEWEENS